MFEVMRCNLACCTLVFSKIVLSKGYWQIRISGDDVRKTAFVTLNGCYEFLRMPLEMQNSGATLVRGIIQLLSVMDNDNVDNYIDDLIVYAKDWKSNLAALKELFNRLQGASLTTRPNLVRKPWTI